MAGFRQPFRAATVGSPQPVRLVAPVQHFPPVDSRQHLRLVVAVVVAVRAVAAVAAVAALAVAP